MTGGTVALIVPVRDDAGPLETLLGRLGDGPDERIVVTAGEDSEVRQLCMKLGARCLTAPPGRGRQQHTGALAASSDWLWFLHADAEPHRTALAQIRQSAADGAVGGYFRFRFQGRQGPGHRLLASLINLRARLGVPYGDQGLYFRRDVYLACGGFPDDPLFEEVPLIRCVRRRGAFVALSTPIGVSSRRWERDGWIRRTLGNRLLAIGYAMGLSPRRLARFYDGKKENRAPRQTRS